MDKNKIRSLEPDRCTPPLQFHACTGVSFSTSCITPSAEQKNFTKYVPIQRPKYNTYLYKYMIFYIWFNKKEKNSGPHTTHIISKIISLIPSKLSSRPEIRTARLFI